jgi:L-2-hydroxyglutarate oxidase
LNGSTDVIIVGGGIVGLATAFALGETHPGSTITVLEKESAVAQHQTGHNSGVLHSGIYYKPGSLKAKNCRIGKKAMEDFCARENIPYKICGKIIVATAQLEFSRLDALLERGRANGVQCELIDQRRLLEIEPHCGGLRALHVPEAGIVNYRAVCERLAGIVAARGNRIVTGARVTAIDEMHGTIQVRSTAGDFTAKFVINCAGLYSDRVTALSGPRPEVKVLPFRGEYFELKPAAENFCRGLIYPVPDPQFPFLGVHFTRMISGGVECGPNAVLAFAREGYRKRDINLRDLCETLAFAGFRKMAARHWRMGLNEMWRSFSKRAFVRALQRLVPEIRGHHLVSAPAGVRAQAISPAGEMVDDFAFDERPRILNVINAPSPAATASLSVGRLIAEKLPSRF